MSAGKSAVLRLSVFLALASSGGCVSVKSTRPPRALAPVDVGVVSAGHIRRVTHHEKEWVEVILVLYDTAVRAGGGENVTEAVVRVEDERGRREPAKATIFLGYQGPGHESRGTILGSVELVREGGARRASKPSPVRPRSPKRFVSLERIP